MSRQPIQPTMTKREIEAEVKTRDSGRVEVWETVPTEYQDSGANDEGYGYQYCRECEAVTEHDDCGNCVAGHWW